MTVGGEARRIAEATEGPWTVAEIAVQVAALFPLRSKHYINNRVSNSLKQYRRAGKIETIRPGTNLVAGVYRWKR